MSFMVKGVRISVSFWFFAILSLFFMVSDPHIRLIAFAAVVIHELGHLVALAVLGVKPRVMALRPFGISIEYDERHMAYKKEIAVASAGPVANLVVFVAALPFVNSSPYTAHLCYLNLGLCILNLIPIKPLDGWRIVHTLFKNYETGRVVRIVFESISTTVNIILFIVSISFFFRNQGNITFVITSFTLLMMQIISFKS